MERMTTAATSVKTAIMMKFCQPRYVWVEVNYCMFLYDRLEDIYIPEQVYRDLVATRM